MARLLNKVESSNCATELDGELVMIHIDTGKFFSLKAWVLISGKSSIPNRILTLFARTCPANTAYRLTSVSRRLTRSWSN